MNPSFCSQCGREFAPGANFCSSCGAKAQTGPAAGYRPRLVRPRQPRVLAGVCAGVALHLGWDIPLTRILFAVFVCITSGCAALLYLVAWVLIPEGQYALAAGTQRQGDPV